ncbi:MAG: hypothetical protein JWM21_2212 [Acidobacteria bacterium]|nr:hypothetical protein [Acidobacteriota bacterium]
MKVVPRISKSCVVRSMALKFVVLFCVGVVAVCCCGYRPPNAGAQFQLTSAAPLQEPPPAPEATPAEDTARYVAWMEKQAKPLNDKPHEVVSLRIGDWGFFYHGDRPVGSWRPLQGRTAVDRSGHAVTETENGDWFALLSTSDLDAAGALKRVAWLFNADGLVPTAKPRTARGDKFTAPALTAKDGAIRFQGWCEAHSDPPYEMRITIVATIKGTKLVVDPASKL